MKAKIRRIGNSLGILIPKDVLQLLKLQEGDEVELESTAKEIELKLRKGK